MKKLFLAAAVVVALLAPASTAHADPDHLIYGHCLKLQAQAPIGLTPSEFNALFNPAPSNGNKPGIPAECLVTL